MGVSSSPALSPTSSSGRSSSLTMKLRQRRWYDNFTGRTRVTAWIALIIVLLACIIFLPLYFARRSNGESNSHAKGAELVLPIVQADWKPQCPTPTELRELSAAHKLNCYPESGATESRCKKRGCCWYVIGEIDNVGTGRKETSWDAGRASTQYGGQRNRIERETGIARDSKNYSVMPDVVPYCIYPSNYGYVVSGPEEQFFDGWEMPLAKLHGPSRYGDDAHVVHVRVEMQTPTRLRIKFYNPSEDENGNGVSQDPQIPVEKGDAASKSSRQPKLYAVSYHRFSVPFGLQVRRAETGTVIFNTSFSGLTFASQFVQLTTKLPSANIHGFGPLVPPLKNKPNSTTWPTWSVFAAQTQEHLNSKIHAVHPMYMCLEDDGRAHAVLLHSSYPVGEPNNDVQVDPTAQLLTYRALGGSLDFYIFLGPKPEDVVKQYTEAIGRPFLPPYWALGLQISHIGVNDLQAVRDSLRDVSKHNISYDVVTLGGEYKNDGLDFTLDHRRFPNFLIFVDELVRNNIHLDMDLDPAVSQEKPSGTYLPFDEGLRYGVFVNNSFGREPLVGQTSSGKSVFFDFGSPNIAKVWTRNIERLRSMTRFHSLTVVENYPFNWRNGSADMCLRDNWNNPPYLPRALATSRLYWQTVCMDGIQWQGNKKVRHYAVHNTYGHNMAKVTYKALSDVLSPHRRSLVVSQSTFTGSGKYTGFWAMDNARTWPHLKQSVATLLSFNIYGIPLVGSAICGMDIHDEDNELCMRWFQLGAFCPLMRMVHDPIFCDKDFGKVARNAIQTRYALLPHLYTLFYKAATEGHTVVRPLFHEFDKDKNTYNITTQFMWGSSLMIVPVLQKGARLAEVYLPHGLWYIFYTGGRLESCGEWVTMEAPLDRIILLIRGGAIIPTQPPGLTTTQSRRNNFHLIATLNEHRSASGQLFWDDGHTKDTLLNNEYVLVNFTVQQNKLTVSGKRMKPLLPPTLTSAYFDSVDIMGLPYQPRLMTISGTSGVLSSRQFTWDPRGKVAQLREIILPLTETVEINWQWTD